MALAVVLVGALLLAYRLLGRHRSGLAFVATAVAATLPVLIVGAGTHPYALSSVDPAASLTVAQTAAGPQTLRLLGMMAWPLLPVLVAFQGMCWWAFRVRAGRRVPSFY